MTQLSESTKLPSVHSTMSATQTITQTRPAGILNLRGPAPEADPVVNKNIKPMTYTGSLDAYEHFDSTPVIGREFAEGLQLSTLLEAPNSDELIRDLAVLVSRRGVCFFRNQDITGQQMTLLGRKIGELSGHPDVSSLHVHPLSEEVPELGGGVIAEISSDKQAKGGGLKQIHDDKSTFATTAWHSDITFENVPSDYAALKIHTLPETGGDTIWASMYEAYDRLSKPVAKFFETLTATHDANFFHDEARRLGIPIKTEGRGHPLNHGDDLRAVHPLIRTNPVTGWKSLHANKAFTKRINDVTRDESDHILNYCNDLVHHNHDLQVRFRWTKNTVALWDNRSTQHCATYDYEAKRAGDRVCSIGEKPFFNSNSSSRKDALKAEGKAW